MAVVVLVINWCNSLSGEFVARTVTVEFDFRAYLENETFKVVRLEESIAFIFVLVNHAANFFGCFSYKKRDKYTSYRVSALPFRIIKMK